MSQVTGFRCNLCGATNNGTPTAADREVPGCSRCGSTIRTRSLMAALSAELFGRVLPVADFPRLSGIRGMGISDSGDYSELLGGKFEYVNTWYHRDPKFDVTDVPESERGRYDFIIASEVLEHVAPPLDNAFRNLYRMLKPTGILLVTVPYTLDAETKEHFPKLHDYGLARLNEGLVLVNRTVGGRLEIHENLVFHGGQGSTLELRVLCERDLRRHIRMAGFREVRFYSEDLAEWGIAHTGWSLPFSARKDQFRLPPSCTSHWTEQWESALTAIRRQREEMAALQAAVAHTTRIEADLQARTDWIKKLDADLETAAQKISELEAEVVARTEWAQTTERHLAERTLWAMNLEKELKEHTEIAVRFRKEADTLCDELQRANAELAELRRSRAVRVGKKLGLS